MGYVVLLPEDQVFDRPSWSPDEPARTMVELGRHATLTSSRANLWRYPPQAENLRHFETVQEEVFVVLEGTFTFFLGEATADAGVTLLRRPDGGDARRQGRAR